MTSLALTRPRPTPAWLIVIAATALLAFYYLTRADAIGVFSPARGWTQLTGRTLSPSWHFVVAALLLGVAPALAARRCTGRPWRELGLGLGRWREGLLWLALGLPLAVLAGWIGASSAAMRAVYPLDPHVTAAAASFLPYTALQFLYFGAWEVLFRGVLLFGLRGTGGDGSANALQTGLSVTAHFGRALDETAAALPAGLIFGWVTLRLRSVWYIALIHWTVGVSQDWFILTRR